MLIGFHCTRVESPKTHDWNKLKHMMGCLWKIRFESLMIAIDEEGNVMTHSDGSLMVRADRKEHSDLFFAIGLGTIINVSKELGLNTTRSREIKKVSNG